MPPERSPRREQIRHDGHAPQVREPHHGRRVEGSTRGPQGAPRTPFEPDSRPRLGNHGTPNAAFAGPAGRMKAAPPSHTPEGSRRKDASPRGPDSPQDTDTRQPGRTGPVTRDRERSAQRSRDAAAAQLSTDRQRPTSSPPQSYSAPGSMRLSKRMSELGLASRREADEWIERGWVRVDGQIVRQLGSRVVEGQHITIDRPAQQMQAQKVTVLINKPIGYVSGQAEDGYEPAMVLVTPQNRWKEDHSGTKFSRDHLRSLVPAGRLDIDSVGLLVLTQDGRVAKTLIGQHSPIEKEYLVRVQCLSGQALPQALSSEQLALLNHGLELDGEALQPARVEWINDDQLRFILVEGKKRQIRRMCEAVGLKVTGLKRVRIGNVMLGDLPVGQWRYLRPDEAF